ncbi:C-8 sterol isomerase [Beauveria bassiana]|nr:C-8 sterol isomerase [Beauveria bassiana]
MPSKSQRKNNGGGGGGGGGAAAPAPGGIGRLLAILGLLTALLASVVYVAEQNLDKFYVFELDHLQDLAKRSVDRHGNDTRGAVRYIVDELSATYPAHINLEEEWVFNNAGGAMGAMYIIHASITEYLIIFGTAVGTEGHTGRHTADDYFHILTGTQTAYVPGEYEPERAPPAPRAGQAVQDAESCFAMEYARGWIPPMLFFGFADGLSSTLDFPTLWRTTYITGKLTIAQLLRGKF